uniref:Pepsin inhibitor-3-like repeated domain-containing protein n=1 Tax=Panagrolaimus sp. JU765 TaxID=591449 RepID=A0AC34PY25_9BILA
MFCRVACLDFFISTFDDLFLFLDCKRNMKCVILLALLAVAVAGPSKRFAGFGGLSGALSAVGGNLGCVVTGDKLYINGLLEKELSNAEQEEFTQYQSRLAEFKKEIRQLIAERRQQALESRKNEGGDMISLSSVENSNSSLPKPPEKPSFCNANATTQYIFDGCKVQNNKVYVGSQYARDLTEDEIRQLQVFDEKMTAYQAQLTSSLQAQVKEIFGDQLASLFGSAGRKGQKSTTPKPITDEAVTTAAPLEAPDAPSFCTIIV